MDVVYALKRQGRTLYGFGGVPKSREEVAKRKVLPENSFSCSNLTNNVFMTVFNPSLISESDEADMGYFTIYELLKAIVNLMRHIRGTCWGADQRSLRVIFLSHIVSYITYAAPALLTLSRASKSKLEAVYNRALK
ncbi:hypothetical protein CAPTEDRAFT_218541, partial [Capitella teleta]